MTSTATLLAQDALGIDAYADAEEAAMVQDDFAQDFEDPSQDDLDYYVAEILPGTHDEEEADRFDRREADFDPDFDPYGYIGPLSRYERWLFGE